MTNKTPWHLWAIGGLTLLWNGFGAFDFSATALRVESYLSQFPPATVDYILDQPWWLFVVWAMGTWGGTIGSLLLLLKNELAVTFLGISLAGAVLSTVVGMINPAPAEMQNWGFTIFIVGVSAGLLYYAMRMKKAGVLN